MFEWSAFMHPPQKNAPDSPPALGKDSGSDSDPAHLFAWFVQDLLPEARLCNACAAAAAGCCGPLRSPGRTPFLPDFSGPQPAFEWTGREDIPDRDTPTAPALASRRRRYLVVA